VIPNPCGPAACTGMPGGAALVGIADTEHPEEVARVMEYLVQEDVMAEFYGRTLFIPGHLGLAANGVDFDTDSASAAAALGVFARRGRVPGPHASRRPAWRSACTLFNATPARATQVCVGERTREEAIARRQADIDEGIRQAGQ